MLTLKQLIEKLPKDTDFSKIRIRSYNADAGMVMAIDELEIKEKPNGVILVDLFPKD